MDLHPPGFPNKLLTPDGIAYQGRGMTRSAFVADAARREIGVRALTVPHLVIPDEYPGAKRTG